MTTNKTISASSLFRPASKAEVAKRQAMYPGVKFKEAFEVKKTKLVDGTWHIHSDLNIAFCELTTLKNLNISIINGNFYCSHNNLTSLEGAPNTVNGYFYCYSNKLTTLEGAPNTVNGDFNCINNDLTTLQGAPTTVNGNFYCYYNTKKFTEVEVREVCVVKGKIYV